MLDRMKLEAVLASEPEWARALPYIDPILTLCEEYGVSPLLLVGMGMRESRWGAALKPPDATGTGDFIKRTWGPYPLPPDGKGWGRGLLQLDYGVNRKVLDANEWWKPEVAIRLALAELVANFRFFSSLTAEKLPLSNGTYFVAADGKGTVWIPSSAAQRRGVAAGAHDDPRVLEGVPLAAAALAAYNTGPLNVLWSMAGGLSPDFTTAGGEYSAWILKRTSLMAAAYKAV